MPATGARKDRKRKRTRSVNGQVFGCEFYPAKEVAQEADANVFLGQSDFHAQDLRLRQDYPHMFLIHTLAKYAR